ncbi:MAG: hypothetical protein R3C31_04340 [Hyphomonadaceae bacterium]
MTVPPPPENAKFDVAVEPEPRKEVLEAEEDEASKREREATLASTFDQSLAHNGKTDEEMLEERQDEARMLGDAAIAAAIVIAVTDEAHHDDIYVDTTEDEPPPETGDDGD